MAESTQQAASRSGASAEPRRLNLGCGNDYREGWVNADISTDIRTDAIVNVFAPPYPFADNEFDHVLVSHILEHVPHVLPGTDGAKNGLILVIEEIWRILKPGGTVEVRVPHHNSRKRWKDPTHTRVVDPLQFEYFSPDHHLNFYSHARFETVHVHYQREFQLGRFFNSAYHFPKYVGRHVNVGRPAESWITLKALK